MAGAAPAVGSLCCKAVGEPQAQRTRGLRGLGVCVSICCGQASTDPSPGSPAWPRARPQRPCTSRTSLVGHSVCVCLAFI